MIKEMASVQEMIAVRPGLRLKGLWETIIKDDVREKRNVELVSMKEEGEINENALIKKHAKKMSIVSCACVKA